jgi:dephospho-CoA kinase
MPLWYNSARMMIGITGTIGAGKGTVVAFFKERGFTHYSGSGWLRKELERRGLTANRDTYSALAGEIRAVNPAGLAVILYEQMLKDNCEKAIIESLHDVEEAKFLKAKGAVILGVDADIPVRYERVLARGSEKDNVTYEHFLEQIAREEAGSSHHNINAVLQTADFVINNNGTKEALHSAIEAIFNQISAQV